jgi:hypothetical protein
VSVFLFFTALFVVEKVTKRMWGSQGLSRGMAMVMCSYCETENQKTEICSFCGADLRAVRPTPKENLSEDDAHLPQPELMKLHTLDLCLLIRFLRKERSEAYHLMQSVRKPLRAFLWLLRRSLLQNSNIGKAQLV